MGNETIQIYDYVQIGDNIHYNMRAHQFRIPNFEVTAGYLRTHKNVYFIFGDNLVHRGKGGAASLRNEPNAIGFITKKYPNNNPNSFYYPNEYLPIFNQESKRMIEMMSAHPNRYYLFSKLGGGLANAYCIFEQVLEPWLLSLEEKFTNCSVLF